MARGSAAVTVGTTQFYLSIVQISANQSSVSISRPIVFFNISEFVPLVVGRSQRKNTTGFGLLLFWAQGLGNSGVAEGREGLQNL